MSSNYNNEPMLDMYIFETTQQIELLEQHILESEKDSQFTEEMINDIFRIMHTIKGSSAMMMFDDIALLAHTIEDIFYYLREVKPATIDYSSLTDMILDSVDYIKVEVEKIKNKDEPDGESSSLNERFKAFLEDMKEEKADNFNIFKALIYYDLGCEMENIRAYNLVHNLEQFATIIKYYPEDIIDNDKSIDMIRQDGFLIYFKTNLKVNEVNDILTKTVFLKELELYQLDNEDEIELNDNKITGVVEKETKLVATEVAVKENKHNQVEEVNVHSVSTTQSIISVSVAKLDILMDLVGEMVISEAMVVQNPDLAGLEIENFRKAARQLNKITNEIQDMVMSIRMVPLAMTFQKMNRIVRDMSKRLNKEVDLVIIGEDTEVDKNIIEHMSDPLMHLVRNALDHGIELPEDRINVGKDSRGKITLEAKNAGSEVIIQVKDNGKGLDREKILDKARNNGLIDYAKEIISDKEIYNMILVPGFSTKENVTEFSGRGVGMDVVTKNIESIGGKISVDSRLGEGTTIQINIPLTIAIIDGMIIKVGDSSYTIPIKSIKESLKPKYTDIIKDPDGNEMVMVRGKCYPILRLHKIFGVDTKITDFDDGIMIMVENDSTTICIFVDELIGQQQVVVKNLPDYIKKIRGLAGCTLLGDGSISLIIDAAGLIQR